MQLENLKAILESITPTFYGSYSPSMVEEELSNFIVFTRINSSFKTYFDDREAIRVTHYQVNLITIDSKTMDTLSKKLEETLKQNDISFTLTSEYINDNDTINTVYEIEMEEFIDG